MNRFLAVTCAVLLLLGAVVPSVRAGEPVVNTFTVSTKVPKLTAGKSYSFTFRVFDAAAGGNELFAEVKSYKVPSTKKITHLLGSVNTAQPLLAEDFLQQVWVEVGTGTKLFPRIKLGPAPLAIGSQSADRLDGLHAAEFAPVDHTHGGAGSGLDADTLDAQHGSFYRNAGNLDAGVLGDARLSGNVDLLNQDRTFTGVKHFNPALGTVPFTVGKTGTVTGLSADTLDGQDGSFYQSATNLNAGTLGTARYSAYADLGAEGYLGNAAGDLALNNGTLQATLYAARAQIADTAAAADALSPPAQSALDIRYGLAPLSQGLTAYTTVTTIDSTGLVGKHTSITIGADGMPIISYHDESNGDLKVLHCGDAACSSGNSATTVDSTGTVGAYTSITIGADGLPVVSYYDESNGDLKVLHCGDAACSSGNSATTVDSDGNVGYGASITIGADGIPIISYYDDSNGALKVLHCGDIACSSGNTATTVDNVTGGIDWQTSITIGADDLPVISYRNNSSYRLKILHCGNTSCSSGNTATTVDSFHGGYYSSITIGADGLPVISYYANSPEFGASKGLKVLHCGNAACSSGNTAITVDYGTGALGQNTSITIGADSLPVLSYWDPVNYDLKVLHCGNAACSSGNTTFTLDRTGNVGQYSSITIGADGLPVISYYDLQNASLKVARLFFKPLGRR